MIPRSTTPYIKIIPETVSSHHLIIDTNETTKGIKYLLPFSKIITWV